MYYVCSYLMYTGKKKKVDSEANRQIDLASFAVIKSDALV